MKAIWELIKETIQEFQRDNVPRLAAALSYYAIFSLAPLLITVIAVSGIILGQGQVQDAILAQIRSAAGPDAADFVGELIESISVSSTNIVAAIVSLLTLFLGALSVFMQIKGALNTIWHVPEIPSRGILWDILNLLKNHLTSFLMVLGAGVVLLISVITNTVLSGISHFVNQAFPFQLPIDSYQLVSQIVFFGAITVGNAAIFKLLPDVQVRWGDVWIGAAFTALLFMIGKSIISAYLGGSAIASAYGAAGTLVVILLWIYYSALIFFLGAEFTKVFAHRYGSWAEKKPTTSASQRSNAAS